MKLGNKILEYRKKSGLSQEGLAEKIDVTRQTISNWELGETSPNPEQLKLLSKEFGVSIDELLDNNIINRNSKFNIRKYLKLKYILILIVIFVLIFLLLAVIKIYRKSNIVKREESIYCRVFNEEHSYNIVFDELTGQVLESGGDSYFYYILNLEKYNDVHQIFTLIEEYVKKNNGSCVMIRDNNLNELIDIQIKEGSLKNTETTLLIRNNTDFNILFGETFWLEKYNYINNSFEKMGNTTGKECVFKLPAYEANSTEVFELKQDWSCMNGKLEKGIYRLVKDVYFDVDRPVNDHNKYNIWVEFEIE